MSRSGVLCNDFLLLAGLATRPLHLAWSPFFLGLEVCLPSHVNEQLERVMPWRSWVVLVHKPQKNNKKTWKVTPTKKTPGTAVPLLRTSLSFFFLLGPERRRPSECYPDNARLAKALETLAACHQEASFLVPVGAVRAVDSLRALSKGGKALVIAGDKG